MLLTHPNCECSCLQVLGASAFARVTPEQHPTPMCHECVTAVPTSNSKQLDRCSIIYTAPHTVKRTDCNTMRSLGNNEARLPPSKCFHKRRTAALSMAGCCCCSCRVCSVNVQRIVSRNTPSTQTAFAVAVLLYQVWQHLNTSTTSTNSGSTARMIT